MKTKKVDRFGHTGKSWYEKEAYKNFLASKFHLDKTESDPVDINKTNESSVEEDKVEPTGVITKKSILLKAKDFFNNNWVITIVGGFIVALIILVIGGYITLNRDQGVQGEKISTIEKDLAELNKDTKEESNNYNFLKGRFDIFKTEVTKDLEFIKKRLGL